MSKLQNKVALVTGAGRGIGRAIALDFAREGAQVAVAARTESELASVVSEASDAGGHAVAFTADLADPKSPVDLAARVKEQLGPIQILVNNAGVGSSGNMKPVVDFDDDYWNLTLQVNLTAPYLLSKAVLPDMLASKWGRIITIASINARRPALHGAAYTASKHGVVGLMRALALEIAGDGITVNCICPGPVATRMNDPRIEYDARRLGVDLAEYEQGLTPIGGRLVPEDISPLAVYLAGDEARMITGQAYNVCGGIQMA